VNPVQNPTLDEFERAFFAGHAPSSNPPEVMVAMPLKRVEYFSSFTAMRW